MHPDNLINVSIYAFQHRFAAHKINEKKKSDVELKPLPQIPQQLHQSHNVNDG